MMKQPPFNWDNEDKYNQLKNFRLEVYNVLKSYDMPGREKTSVIKNWQGRKGLQLLETLTQAEKENCETSEGLFKKQAHIVNNHVKERITKTVKHQKEFSKHKHI